MNSNQRRYSKKYLYGLKKDKEKYKEYKEKRNEQQRKRRSSKKNEDSQKYMNGIRSDPKKYEDYKEKRNAQQRKRRIKTRPSSIGRGQYSRTYVETLQSGKTRNGKKKIEKYKEKRKCQQRKRRSQIRPSTTGRGKYSRTYEQRVKRDAGTFLEYKAKRNETQKARRLQTKPSNIGRGKYSKKYLEGMKDKSTPIEEYRNKRSAQQKKRRAKVVEMMREKQNHWPSIPSQKIKQRCVKEYRNSFSAHALKRTICAVCGEEHLGMANMKTMEISKIPNKELLRTSESDFSRYVNEGLMIEARGMESEGMVNVCNQCNNTLKRGAIPLCSIKNIPLGEQPQCFQILTLPEKILIAMYRMKVILLKLQPFKSGSHIAIKGNSITFPHNMSSISNKIEEFPVNVKELSNVIKLVFIGNTRPQKRHLKHILTVRRQVIIDALEFLRKHHYMYKDIRISAKNIKSLPKNNVPTDLFNSMTLFNSNESKDNEELLNGPFTDEPIFSTHTGIVDVEGNAISEDDKKCAAVKQADPILVVPHGAMPINEYNNVELWLGAFSHLFPYGIGGPRTTDGRQIMLKTFLKHLLNFSHYYFRKELVFVMSMYNVIHKMDVCIQASLTIRRPLFSSTYSEMISSVKSEDLKDALLKKKDISQLSPQVQCILKHLYAIGRRIPGSAYSKMSMRKEIHAMMVSPICFILLTLCCSLVYMALLTAEEYANKNIM